MELAVDEVETMLAEWRIRDVVARYARGVDRRDATRIRECFHSDARQHYGVFDGSVDEFIPWVLDEVAQYSRTVHFQGTSIIDWPDVRRGDVATVETYAVALSASDDGTPRQSWFGGIRYLDRFERRADSDGLPGRWKIAERTVVGDWLRIDPVENHLRFGAGVTTGQPGADDALFHLLARAAAHSGDA